MNIQLFFALDGQQPTQQTRVIKKSLGDFTSRFE
jgi:hypothetical protein